MKSSLERTALLVMDVQPGIIDRAKDKAAYLASMQKIVDAAHAAQVPVFFVVVGFRPGAPEIAARNKMFSSMNTDILINPLPLVTVGENDLLITKRRVSAFTGSDLEVLLRAQQIDHLVLTGISTSGVVLSTLREAADKDYQITVLSDLCADIDDDVHTVLLQKVFPRQATVITSEEWINQ